MIIDVHHHYMPRVSEERLRRTIRYALMAAGRVGSDLDPEMIMERARNTWADPTGEGLLALMEEAGVDLTVICMVDDAGDESVRPEAVMRANEAMGKVASRYPEKVVALAGVDPRRPEAPDMLKRCFEEFGVRGLKYHPDYGYDPSGPDSYRLLEVLAGYGGILLSHTGPLLPPSRCRFSDPRLLADLAVDFPEVRVIAAHMGGTDWRPWAALSAYQPTLYGDLAMWDMLAFSNYALFCRELRDLMDFAGPSKILFGTDNPIFNTIRSTGEWIRLLRELPEKAPEGIRFTREDVRAILGGNAAALLGLNVR